MGPGTRVRAMVMAGGRGLRMSGSSAPMPKPLVPLLGIPLLERCLYQLSRFSLRQVDVVVPAHTPAIGEFLAQRRARLEAGLDLELTIQVERDPRGNMGAVTLLQGRCDHALVTFADNVTDMELDALVDQHLRQDADITLASHQYETRIPFGGLDLVGTEVTAYNEKPLVKTPICSGTYVLSAAAIEATPLDRPVRADQLISARIAAGERVQAWPHQARWYDVNDLHTAQQACRGIRDSRATFERFAQGSPPEHLAVLCVDGGCVRVSEGGPLSRLPTHPISAPQPAEEALASWLPGLPTRQLVTLDHIDERGQLVRVHAHTTEPGVQLGDTSLVECSELAAHDELARRLLAWLEER